MNFYRYWLNNIRGTKYQDTFEPSTIHYLIKKHGSWPEPLKIAEILDEHTKRSIFYKIKIWSIAKQRSRK